MRVNINSHIISKDAISLYLQVQWDLNPSTVGLEPIRKIVHIIRRKAIFVPGFQDRRC